MTTGVWTVLCIVCLSAVVRTRKREEWNGWMEKKGSPSPRSLLTSEKGRICAACTGRKRADGRISEVRRMWKILARYREQRESLNR